MPPFTCHRPRHFSLHDTRRGHRCRDRALEGDFKSAGETGAKFIFRGLAPTLEKAHPLLFTGIKGGMSFATYNGISAVINGEPAGQVALRMLEGGVGGFAFNVAGSVLFKGARRAWNSLSKGEKVQVLAGELERAAKDPAVVKSIKNAVADTVSKVEASAKKGLQAAKGGLLDAVKTVKSWLKPGSAEGSLTKTAEIKPTSAKIERPFEIGRNGRISKLNANKIMDAFSKADYSLAKGDLVELKIENGKVVEAQLFNGTRDIKQIPSGTDYRVLKYEGVGYDGKNPSFVRATEADLATAKNSLAPAAGKEGEANTPSENAVEIEGPGNAKRQFTSPHKYVGETANAIDLEFPNRVIDIDKKVYRLDGSIITDYDIELDNIVIQVKSGSGKKLTTQMIRTQASTGKTVIGYTPDLNPSSALVRGARAAGFEVFTTWDDLLAYLASH
jgi:hypothetical protein